VASKNRSVALEVPAPLRPRAGWLRRPPYSLARRPEPNGPVASPLVRSRSLSSTARSALHRGPTPHPPIACALRTPIIIAYPLAGTTVAPGWRETSRQGNASSPVRLPIRGWAWATCSPSNERPQPALVQHLSSRFTVPVRGAATCSGWPPPALRETQAACKMQLEFSL
jgi:hypothetical protein